MFRTVLSLALALSAIGWAQAQAPAASGLRSLSDTCDRKIAVMAGSSNERALNAQLKRRLINATVVPFKSRDAAFRLAVNTGLAQLYSSGEVVEIFRRWFENLGTPPGIILAAYALGAIPE